MRKNLVTIGISLILVSSASYETHALGIYSQGKAPCRIEVDDAHISKTVLRSEGRLAVKVNARSICDAPQQGVRLTVEIYALTRGKPRLLSTRSTNPLSKSSSGFKVTNKETVHYCTSNKRTSYFGVAFATAQVMGETVYAKRTRSPRIIKLDCGA